MNKEIKKIQKQTIYNDDKLKRSQIDEIVTRVKVFLVNSNNEILLANSNGGYQLPGGHVENEENLEDAVLREIQEETGITLDLNEVIDPFYEVIHYSKNYKNTSKNRMSNIIYYLVSSDKVPKLDKLNLTENEKKNNFSIEYIQFNEFEDKIRDTQENNQKEINRTIAKEIFVAFSFLKEYLLNK